MSFSPSPLTPLPQGARGDARHTTGGPPLPRQGERAGPSAAAEGPVSHGLGVRAVPSPRDRHGMLPMYRVIDSEEDIWE